jgi:hypothetical protein
LSGTFLRAGIDCFVHVNILKKQLGVCRLGGVKHRLFKIP